MLLHALTSLSWIALTSLSWIVLFPYYMFEKHKTPMFLFLHMFFSFHLLIIMFLWVFFLWCVCSSFWLIETLSMKGLTLNCMDRKSEAYELVRQGLKVCCFWFCTTYQSFNIIFIWCSKLNFFSSAEWP